MLSHAQNFEHVKKKNEYPSLPLRTSYELQRMPNVSQTVNKWQLTRTYT